MPRLFLGEATSRDKSLIMDMRMLHFGKSGEFIEECPYSTMLISRNIKEVNGLSILSSVSSSNIEIAYIIGGNYGTFNVTGRLTVLLTKLYAIQGFCDTLIRHGDGYIQNFVLFEISAGITPDYLKRILKD